MDNLTITSPTFVIHHNPMHAQARNVLKDAQHQWHQAHARQIVQACKHPDWQEDFPMPDTCAEMAPPEPNVYTDGSLKNPTIQQWSLGGVGIWWPERDLAANPLSEAEAAFTRHRQENGALSLWGSMAANRCSSTRAELAAGCIAATAPGPVHQATDSKAYQSKMRLLLRGKNLTKRRPWALQPDGDLWSAMEQLIKHKGAHSIRITWVKGHAKLEHIESGVSTHAHKAGNDRADTLADQGVDSHIQGLSHLANFYVAKQTTATKLLTRIYAMFHRVLEEEHNLREKKNAATYQNTLLTTGTQHNHTKAPPLYTTPPWRTAHSLDIDRLDSAFSLDPTNKDLVDVYNFLRTATWMPTTEGENGTSWIELLARFKSLGGFATTATAGHYDLTKLRSLRQQLDHFTLLQRQLTTTYLKPEDQPLFRPARHKQPRLIGYGFTQHVPCISALLCINEDEAKVMHEDLAELNVALTRKAKAQLHEGTLLLKHRKLGLKKPPPWKTCLDTDDTKLSQLRATFLARTRTALLVSDDFSEPLAKLSLHCHVCSSKRTLVDTALLHRTTWKPVRCKQCGIARKASKWLCDCSKPWHTCTNHRVVGMKVHKQALFMQESRKILKADQTKGTSEKPNLGNLGEKHTRAGAKGIRMCDPTKRSVDHSSEGRVAKVRKALDALRSLGVFQA